jgi:hypothetical protein
MAVTAYGVNDALAVKLWSKELAVEALKKTYFKDFIGSSPSSLIQLKSETSKGPGDKITFGLRMQASGDGVLGDGSAAALGCGGLGGGCGLGLRGGG